MAQDPYRYFRPEARDLVDQFSRSMLDLEADGDSAAIVQRLLRLAHTLKGAARVVKQSDIASRAHAIEDALSAFRDPTQKPGREHIAVVLAHLDAINAHLMTLSPAGDQPAKATDGPRAKETSRTIRADLAETDAVIDGVAETQALMRGLRAAVNDVEQTSHLAELLLSNISPFGPGGKERRLNTRANQRLAIAEDLRRKIDGIERSLSSAIDQLDRELRQLREAAERLRLVPAGSLFSMLESTARETARAQSKQVIFAGSGHDMRLDVEVLETIQSALIQIVRNAVAHGIETPDERTRAGKPPAGSISLAIFRRDRRIVFACSDDGRGIDFDAVRRVAADRGLIGSAPGKATPDDIVRMLLRGGISTSAAVTEVSGRGIGLDVVREAATALGGDVGFRSTPGAGSTFELTIPPSLAAIEALIVETGGSGNAVAIPLDAVRATRRLAGNELSLTATAASVLHEQLAIPFLPLDTALEGVPWSVERNWPTVIVSSDNNLAAIGVERLRGTAKIVARPLPQCMAASPLLASASLDADGNPRLVLDPDALVAAARRGSMATTRKTADKRPVLVVDDSLTTRMLEQSILESAGYDVDVALSGEEALQRVAQKRYALILVDVEMPGMDGFSFIERIRSQPATRDIPAILVTSLAESEHRQRGRDVGAQGYIVKSEFDQADLLSMIRPLMV